MNIKPIRYACDEPGAMDSLSDAMIEALGEIRRHGYLTSADRGRARQRTLDALCARGLVISVTGVCVYYLLARAER